MLLYTKEESFTIAIRCWRESTGPDMKQFLTSAPDAAC